MLLGLRSRGSPRGSVQSVVQRVVDYRRMKEYSPGSPAYLWGEGFRSWHLRCWWCVDGVKGHQEIVKNRDPTVLSLPAKVTKDTNYY
ncbi:hypothetical protein NDU88_004447 [Pleurodeles waltl]|uniref:Uncharacterized protein n=1 Tax=Pleurodeles waltl TaxID=8319 RepID=A0AAV7MWF1_PLEWA|nr:hypothetical protein NDU88_004447 [Pleurodeles waltl]